MAHEIAAKRHRASERELKMNQLRRALVRQMGKGGRSGLGGSLRQEQKALRKMVRRALNKELKQLAKQLSKGLGGKGGKGGGGGSGGAES
jgi:galactokinase/mevalonate kinase-like predicted kinase